MAVEAILVPSVLCARWPAAFRRLPHFSMLHQRLLPFLLLSMTSITQP